MKKRSVIIIAIFVALIVSSVTIVLSSGMLQPSIAEKTDSPVLSQVSNDENSNEISSETESNIVESESTSNVSEISKKNESSIKENSNSINLENNNASSSNGNSSSSSSSGSSSKSSSSSSSSGGGNSSSSSSKPSSGSSSSSSHSHSYSSKTVKATCTSEGYTVYTCSCGASYTDNYTSATGHKWSDWKTIKSATTSSEGKKQRTCSSCGKTESKTIAKVKSSSGGSSTAGEHKITGARKAVYSYRGDHGDKWSNVNLVDLINEERAKEGLCKLEWTADLYAQDVKDDPDLLQWFSSSCFDSNGKFDPYRLAEVKEPLEGAQKMADMGFATHGEGIGCSCVGSTKHDGDTIEQALRRHIRGYMNSPGHRDIIMCAGSHSVTASYAIDANGTVYTAILIAG